MVVFLAAAQRMSVQISSFSESLVSTAFRACRSFCTSGIGSIRRRFRRVCCLEWFAILQLLGKGFDFGELGFQPVLKMYLQRKTYLIESNAGRKVVSITVKKPTWKDITEQQEGL